MYCPVPEEVADTFFYRLFCNEFIVFFGSSIIIILYYSLNVVESDCLEKAARKLKKKLSNSVGGEGNIVEFITMSYYR